jgi:hypothetical protein
MGAAGGELVLDADPPHVWHQEVAAPSHADGYDGVVNDGGATRRVTRQEWCWRACGFPYQQVTPARTS